MFADNVVGRGWFVLFTFSVIIAVFCLVVLVSWYLPVQTFGAETTWRIWIFAIIFFACLIYWRAVRGKKEESYEN